jgi:hypothetical protein
MTYDRYGNRKQQSISSGCVAPMTCPTNSITIDLATNRITGSPYDANGNMTNDGSNTLAYETIPINHDYIGGQSIQGQANNTGPDPTALVPRNPSITINDNGAFFTRGLVAPNGMRSGTPLNQGSTLLHELGHATGVLLQDGAGAPNAIANQATNEAALKQHCAKTLASLPNN